MFCPYCGAKNEPPGRYCLRCGRDLRAVRPVQPPPSQPAPRRPTRWLLGAAALIALAVILVAAVILLRRRPLDLARGLRLGQPPTATRAPTGVSARPTGTVLPTPTPVQLESEATSTLVVTHTPPPQVTPPLPGASRTWEADGSMMVYVPAGEFGMGSTNEQTALAYELCQRYYATCERTWFDDEKPLHTVSLAGFWIDKYEVTNAQYRRCVEAGQCRPPSESRSATRDRYYGNPEFDNYPVVGVSWDDAQAYCRWSDKRMPSEAEWERAARGSDERTWPWGNAFDASLANSCDRNCAQDSSVAAWDDGYADTSPVGHYSPQGDSPYGVADLAGNVWEWVADWYAPDYYGHSPASSPQGPATGERKVVRGGSFASQVYFLRTTHRNRYAPDSRLSNVGFRCAR